MDIEALKQQIEAAARAAFTEMVRLHGDEGIYAFALYSDAGAMTVCPSTNTRAYLESGEKHGDEEDEEEADAYFKFAPAEWKYEMLGADDAFNAISTQAREHVLALEGAAFEQFREALFEACIATLEKLRREGFFRQAAGHEVFLTFEVSDHDMEPAQVRSIITRLNEGAYRDEYLAWMQSWGQ